MTVVTSTVIILIVLTICLADTSLCESPSQEHCSNQTQQSYFYQLLLEESYRAIVEDSFVWTIWSWLVEYQAWILSILGSAVVGLSGIFPLLVIPIEEGANLKTGAAASTLRVLLSFAVGGLLGDVFLHLLPEAWAAERPPASPPGVRGPRPSMVAGMWVLAGILMFTVLEMACPDAEDQEEPEDQQVEEATDCATNNNHPSATNCAHKVVSNGTTVHSNSSATCSNGVSNRSNGTNGAANGVSNHSNGTNGAANGVSNHSNGILASSNGSVDKDSVSSSLHNGSVVHTNGVVPHCNGSVRHENGKAKLNGHVVLTNGTSSSKAPSKSAASGVKSPPVKQVAGYLNLLANSIDNFMHGLAVGGGFLVSVKMGALTTLAILIHEVPHEIGDFAILLRAGFSRWDAARAQLYTAGSGLLGALTAVACSSSNVESRTSWVVPFTAGGFLHIALVTVLPELLAERDKWESAKQLAGLMTGMCVMAVLTACFE